MSSADPTRLDELNRCYAVALPAREQVVLTICLFQTFKERVSLPVGET